MLKIVQKLFGTKSERDLKAMRPLIDKINSFEPQMKKLSDDELKAQTPKFRQMLANGATLESILPEAFATVREASVRTLGMRHFDVQLMGGIALTQGKISEMKTGEGKTLTATLPMYLHGLTGKGAHLVTVNDYLASRDSKWMGTIYEWLGLTVGCITNDISDEDRMDAYKADITYGTNNEFAFDYLRDNMKFSLEDYVQRGHNFCIVDEVDSILIDEARTPLLISGPSEGKSDLYEMANKIIARLERDKHFTCEEKTKSAMLTDDGVLKIQEMLKIESLYTMENSVLLHHINQALRANYLFARDVDYVVRENQVIIVDEFTGRLKEGSRWSDGLHQAIEAKEGVKIKQENQTLASITFQNYFRLYSTLAGMTGTAETEAEEFMKIYHLDVIVIPTNMPMVRQDNPDTIYKNSEAKYKAAAGIIEACHKKGQPVLVGTTSIEKSEKISEYLNKLKIPHEVLNAKQHEREANIVADAGKPGAVTIATNMAGRGTDIKLTAETKAAGGLYILGTERHESRRIDNQLRGRSGRQGDPGESRFLLSLEDDLMRIFGSQRIQGLMNTLGMKDDEPIEHRMVSNAIAKAQKKVEGHNFEIRKHLLEYDNIMHEQRRLIYRIRRDILGDVDNMGFVEEIVEDVCHMLVESFKPERKIPLEQWDWDNIAKTFKQVFNAQMTLTLDDCEKNFKGDLAKYISESAKQILKEKFSKYAEEQIKPALREILLSIFDQYWKDHLLGMDHLKEGINLRAYAQKDPLSEYKREAFTLFEQMRITVKRAVVQNIFYVQLYTQDEIEELKRKQEEQLEAQLEAHKRAQEVAEGKKTISRNNQKVGRNDICPCGTGKKFKHCHGA